MFYKRKVVLYTVIKIFYYIDYNITSILIQKHQTEGVFSMEFEFDFNRKFLSNDLYEIRFKRNKKRNVIFNVFDKKKRVNFTGEKAHAIVYEAFASSSNFDKIESRFCPFLHALSMNEYLSIKEREIRYEEVFESLISEHEDFFCEFEEQTKKQYTSYLRMFFYYQFDLSYDTADEVNLAKIESFVSFLLETNASKQKVLGVISCLYVFSKFLGIDFPRVTYKELRKRVNQEASEAPKIASKQALELAGLYLKSEIRDAFYLNDIKKLGDIVDFKKKFGKAVGYRRKFLNYLAFQLQSKAFLSYEEMSKIKKTDIDFKKRTICIENSQKTFSIEVLNDIEQFILIRDELDQEIYLQKIIRSFCYDRNFLLSNLESKTFRDFLKAEDANFVEKVSQELEDFSKKIKSISAELVLRKKTLKRNNYVKMNDAALEVLLHDTRKEFNELFYDTAFVLYNDKSLRKNILDTFEDVETLFVSVQSREMTSYAIRRSLRTSLRRLESDEVKELYNRIIQTAQHYQKDL